jgi:uncharacterized surface protein with fasciclin (FAS1) repeats
MALLVGLMIFATAAGVSYGQQKDIVDTAVSAGSFNTLVAAVKAAGLVETLKAKGPFTVFAPTDEAFGKLPRGTLEDLLKPGNKDKLTSILTYHVVVGMYSAEETRKLYSLETVNGKILTLGKRYKKMPFLVNDAQVITPDIHASNGVIHVIDTVLIPK